MRAYIYFAKLWDGMNRYNPIIVIVYCHWLESANISEGRHWSLPWLMRIGNFLKFKNPNSLLCSKLKYLWSLVIFWFIPFLLSTPVIFVVILIFFFFSFPPNQLSKSSWLYFWNNFYTNSFLAISALLWRLFLPIIYTTENLLFYLFPVLSFL